MIVRKDHKDLKRTERYGSCLSCGSKRDLYKLECTQPRDKHSTTFSLRLCSECASELKQKLGEIECLQ